MTATISLKPSVVSAIFGPKAVLSSRFRKHQIEHDVSHQKGQGQVQALAANVQNQGLSTTELFLEFTKIGGQANADKGQAEEPAAEYFGHATDGPMVDEGLAGIAAQALIQQREYEGKQERTRLEYFS
jgi:hypothetical protein